MYRFCLHTIFLTTVIAALWSVSSCETPITDPMQIVFPDSNISYNRFVQPFFNVTCNFSGCHNEESRAGRLSLASYFDVVFDRPGIVVPGRPEQSLLAQIIDITVPGRPPHRPAFQTRITVNHIRGIQRWIREGAQ